MTPPGVYHAEGEASSCGIETDLFDLWMYLIGKIDGHRTAGSAGGLIHKAAGLAKKALVQISYAIGVAKPISVSVDTQGTAAKGVTDEYLSEQVAGQFPLTPAWITKQFGLDKPGPNRFLYADVAARGQVGIAGYPWEQLDKNGFFSTLLPR